MIEHVDAVGNRLSSVDSGNYDYNANNEMLTDNSGSYNYDNNGNLVARPPVNGQLQQYSYNSEDRLSSVMANTTLLAQYYYDPFGRRL